MFPEVFVFPEVLETRYGPFAKPRLFQTPAGIPGSSDSTDNDPHSMFQYDPAVEPDVRPLVSDLQRPTRGFAFIHLDMRLKAQSNSFIHFFSSVPGHERTRQFVFLEIKDRAAPALPP